MSHIYEERLQRDLERIRTSVASVAANVEKALRDALQAFLRLDKALANSTVLGDLPINRKIRQIDRLCHFFVARHLPSAGHLRYISSVMRTTIALERMGDYAATIAREAKTLASPVDESVQRAAHRMAEQALTMLGQAIQAFDEQNADLARGTMGYAYQVDNTFSGIFDKLVQIGEKDGHSIQDLFGTLITLNRIERVSDQAKNICEETIFAVTGETKKPKVYRILFLEKTDDCLGKMAVAIAEKAYPEAGAYSSAGVVPAPQINVACSEFLEEMGLDIDDPRPHLLDQFPENLDDFHIIVSLDGSIDQYVTQVPFHTTSLEWSLPSAPTSQQGELAAREALDAVYRTLTAKIGDLMDILHGEELG